MRWATIIAVLLAALAVAGCGGSNKSASSNTTTTTTTTSTTATNATTTTSGQATTSANTTTTTAASGSTTPVFASGKCRDLAQSATKIGQDFSSSVTSGTANLDTLAKEFQAFVGVVPSEIKGDVQTIANAFTAYAKALQGVHFTAGQVPSAADLQKMQAAVKSFDQQKVRVAELHIQAWTKANC